MSGHRLHSALPTLRGASRRRAISLDSTDCLPPSATAFAALLTAAKLAQSRVAKRPAIAVRRSSCISISDLSSASATSTATAAASAAAAGSATSTATAAASAAAAGSSTGAITRSRTLWAPPKKNLPFAHTHRRIEIPTERGGRRRRLPSATKGETRRAGGSAGRTVFGNVPWPCACPENRRKRKETQSPHSTQRCQAPFLLLRLAPPVRPRQ